MAESATSRLTPARRARSTTVGELVAERPGIEKHCSGAVDARGGRSDHLDAGGKRRGTGLTGDRAHLHSRVGQLFDERAADVAGCARDKNCVHAIKDGATLKKVTAESFLNFGNFLRGCFVVST